MKTPLLRYKGGKVTATLALLISFPTMAPRAAADELDPRQEIQAVIAEGMEAARRGDTAALLSRIPQDFVLERIDGSRLGKSELGAILSQRAAGRHRTLRLEGGIERIAVAVDRAEVWTFLDWERIAPAGTSLAGRRLLTIHRHQEWWRRVEGVWESYRIRELGSEIFVDGVRQSSSTCSDARSPT